MHSKHTNALYLARRRRGLTRKQVAHLLGYKGRSAISRHERGVAIPSLVIALGFEILYRVPVAYLYPDLYRELRDRLRAEEAILERGQLFGWETPSINHEIYPNNHP